MLPCPCVCFLCLQIHLAFASPRQSGVFLRCNGSSSFQLFPAPRAVTLAPTFFHFCVESIGLFLTLCGHFLQGHFLSGFLGIFIGREIAQR